MATGRTKTRWIRFLVDDSGGTPREIPINSLGPVGFVYEENDVTAWQDAVKNYLAGQPDAAIDVGGPFDNSAVAAVAASGLAPVLSGSHTVLKDIAGVGTPLGLAIMFGIRAYWATGDPVFGVVAPSATSGYLCTKYTVEGEMYSARFVPYGSTVPAWGSAILT
jgi:hypothetical protein